MIRDTFKFLSITRYSVGNGDSSRRLALGATLGMMIGLIPKDSMFAYVIFLLLMISTANLFCAIVSGFLFSWIGFAFDSFTHKLGGLLLTNDHLESMWAWIYEIPLMPWTRFNNTVVLGSLITGLLLCVPVYMLSHWFFEKFGSAIHQRICGNWIYRWLVAPVQVPGATSSGAAEQGGAA